MQETANNSTGIVSVRDLHTLIMSLNCIPGLTCNHLKYSTGGNAIEKKATSTGVYLSRNNTQFLLNIMVNLSASVL